MVNDDGKWSKVTENGVKWRSVTGRDGEWRVVTEWWSALTRWSKVGPMERGTEFGTEVQSEIWYMASRLYSTRTHHLWLLSRNRSLCKGLSQMASGYQTIRPSTSVLLGLQWNGAFFESMCNTPLSLIMRSNPSQSSPATSPIYRTRPYMDIIGQFFLAGVTPKMPVIPSNPYLIWSKTVT